MEKGHLSLECCKDYQMLVIWNFGSSFGLIE